MDLAALRPLLDRIAGVRAACVGDLMLDRYVYGEVSRISPEAPVPVFRARHETSMLGAAGNVARNVAALGGRARLYGELGTDVAGEVLLALIKAEAGVEPCLHWRPDGSTVVKTRFVAAGQQILRLDEEDDPDLGDYGVPPTIDLALHHAGCVLVSDYAKGLITETLMRVIHERAGEAVVVVDPKGRDFARYGAVDVLKPNAAELAAATAMPTGEDEEVRAALGRALELCEAKVVVVTRGAQGMSALVRETGEGIHLPARPREVYDVSGAGDTSLAALGLALAAGAELETAMAFAIEASGLVVQKRGTAVVTSAELLAAVPAEPGVAGVVVVDAAEAARRAEAWRKQGLRVGFTNGCFDVLHAGHVAYLAQARAWCDRLIVGVNSDASVRGLKGDGRPVNDLASRSAVLGALAAVDLVTAFDAPTPAALIEAVRPDVLVKGADYEGREVVGADFVRSYGGEVRLAPLVAGQSSSRIIDRLREG